jgi:hypothetical protein
MAGGAKAPAAPHCPALHACGVARSGPRAGSRSWQSVQPPRDCSGVSSRLSEQGLNDANVPAALEQMGRKAVAKRMQRDRLAQPRGFGGLRHQPGPASNACW